MRPSPYSPKALAAAGALALVAPLGAALAAPAEAASAPLIDSLDVPQQEPVTRPDFFNAAAGRTTTIGEGGVLFNDTDPQGDPLIAKLVSGATHGLGFIESDGTVIYTPAAGFTGEDHLTYTARDPGGHTSAPETVTITVTGPTGNNPPSVGALKGGSLGGDGVSGLFRLGVFDFETPAGSLKLSASSSNAALVPNTSLTLGGTGSTRTLGIKAISGSTGTAVVTVRVADGAGASSSFTINVRAGTSSAETLTGSANADLLLGRGGADTLLGLGGFDLLAGGGGDDTLTGGAGTDNFRGHTGANVVTDFNAALGETELEVIT